MDQIETYIFGICDIFGINFTQFSANETVPGFIFLLLWILEYQKSWIRESKWNLQIKILSNLKKIASYDAEISRNVRQAILCPKPFYPN